MVQESAKSVKLSFSTIDIPKLPAFEVAMGIPNQAEWEIYQGHSSRALLAVGSQLDIRVKLQNAGPQAAVRISSQPTNQGTGESFNWQALSLRDREVFGIHLIYAQAGRYTIFGQYSLDGKQWYWLRGDPLLVIVYPRQIQGLRMYILIPTASGPLNEWPALLPGIAAMGFTMIHLLPLSRQGASHSPYAARSLFTIEPDLVAAHDPRPAETQWEDFVAAASRQSIGLCLDLVLNHVAIDSELVAACPHWIVPDQSEVDGFKRAGFWSGEVWEKWEDLALLNFSHPHPRTRQEIWNYMRAYAIYWARFASQTRGMVRLDNLHSTHPLFAVSLTRELREHYPELGILGEFFGAHESLAAQVRSMELDLILATTWEHHFTHELRRYLRYLHETAAEIPWFCPVNSHDSGPPAQEFASVLATKPRYLVSVLLGCGTSGLSQGVEGGLLEKIDFIGRKPSLRYAKDQDFRPLVRQVNELLAHQRCFQQGGAIHFVDQEHTAVIAAIRYLKDDRLEPVYLVIANLDIHNTQALSIDLHDPLLKGRRLRDVFAGQDIASSLPLLHLQLEPCGVRVISASQATA